MFREDIREIIKWTLDYLDMYSDDALELIYRTGMAESKYKHLKQMNNGPAVGFFQCEPETYRDIIENYVNYRQGIKDKLIGLGYKEEYSKELFMSNIALQVAFCRLKYRRDKHPIPKKENLEEQGKYWKRVYNSKLGKGTVEHFVSSNR